MPYLIMFSSNTNYKGKVGRGRKEEREGGNGECNRESTEAPPRSLRVFLVFFSAFFSHTLTQQSFSGGEQRLSLGKSRKGATFAFSFTK